MSRFQPTRRRVHAMWMVALALAVWHTLAAQPATRLSLELADYAQVPITGDLTGAEHAGPADQGEFSSGRAKRPAILRE